MRLVAAAAALLLAGCSGGRSTAPGRAIFDRSCARCHTLTGHDTTAPGGDLRVGRLTAADVASFARVMPVEPPLSAAEARAVGRYVASADGRRTARGRRRAGRSRPLRSPP